MADQEQLPVRSGPETCGNCGTRLEGKFCHQCGQAARNPMRHMPEFLADAADTVFSFDSRFARTLPLLFLRPGRLTVDYFAGRRARYIPPFRLAFLLALALFFVFRLGAGDLELVQVSDSDFSDAGTPAEVDKMLEQKNQALDQAMEAPGVPEVARSGMRQARERIRQQAAARRIELAGLPAPAGSAPGAVEVLDVENPWDEDWDPDKYPVGVGWFPDAINHWLQDVALQLHANLRAMNSDDPEVKKAAIHRFSARMISAIPQTLFVMLPVFSLLLTVLYVFKRRLYIEHLIVAMHSHAFLFLAGLVLVLLFLAAKAASSVPLLPQVLFWLQFVLWCWIPLYLLLMQKRVYGQGWPLTALKFVVVGTCYLILLGIALFAAAIVGLASA